ncbi:signal peptide peptidase SppA [Aerococcus sp. 1KP-2016]|uniref:signal peptide peptidase SppA n=1 Tax=Aerococcus sp. 1KP-2016 TaxID=1981982 RepID=UPI000B98E6C7|nr:signal peptide peptidase SppA [Aerococcus sp. 1KP-2016]OYQ68131.1 signal peptide peptidase SppA [Aerococcus sp. 1KP-2016]
MNKKSWIIAIVAVIILVLGVLGTNLSQQTSMNGWMTSNSNPLTSVQNTIESGDVNRQIAVLNVDGTIMDNSGASSFSEGMDYQGILDAVEAIKGDETVKALMLNVDSPGGGVYESVELYNALADLKESRDIPIYVSMGQTAASGGYMISMVADQIYADAETTTGSIGVIMQIPNFSGFMEEHGLAMDTYKSGALKDMGSSYREASDEEKDVLNGLINEKYNRFVEIVAHGRGLSTDEVKKLADGRIYTGQQAVDNGLVDAIGYEEDALAALKADNNLEGASVVDYTPSQATSWVNDFVGLLSKNNLFTGNEASNVADEMTQILDVLESTSTPQFYYMYGGE